MADVSISYKGNEIASMNATGVKTLLTGSTFCEGDITVAYTKPAAPTPTLQTKSATYTPTTSQQTASITADAGYDGLDEVNVTVNAMPSGTAGTPTATKGTVSSNSVSVTPSVTNTTGYITGGTINGTPVTVSASELVSGTKNITASGTTDVTNYASASVASGSATTPATTITANPSISVSSGGLITASVSASQSVTPTVSAGYVSSGTAGTITVSGSNTSQLTTQAAQTVHPSATDQTIASGKYLTGAQTVKGVLLTNLSADNIKKDVVVKVGDSTDDDCVTSVTGTYEGGGGGVTMVSVDVTNLNRKPLSSPWEYGCLVDGSSTVTRDEDYNVIVSCPENSMFVVVLEFIPPTGATGTVSYQEIYSRGVDYYYAVFAGTSGGSIY